MTRGMPLTAALTLFLIGAAESRVSFAALGGDMDSVRRDHAMLRAADTITATASYDIHEASTATGERLREYVNHSGTVFALTWQGRRAPDVGALLGAYAGRYQNAVNNHRGSHHVLNLEAQDLVVTVVHLPRGWQLQALLAGAIPEGVTRAEIR